MSNKKLLPTFKKWRQLHENFGGAIPLGVKTPESLGVVGSVTSSLAVGSNLEESLDELDIESLERLEEACKKVKGKKKMLADLGEKKPEIDMKKIVDDDEEEEEEEVPEKGGHDEPDDEDDDEDDEPVLDKEPELVPKEKPELLLAKKKAKKAKKMAAEATEETDNWWTSVKSQMAGETTQRWDGVATEPQPGEPGFAPQTRLGWFQ